jgi:hypothetical protein
MASDLGRERLAGFAQWKHPTDSGVQQAAVDEPGQFGQLVTTGFNNEIQRQGIVIAGLIGGRFFSNAEQGAARTQDAGRSKSE